MVTPEAPSAFRSERSGPVVAGEVRLLAEPKTWTSWTGDSRFRPVDSGEMSSPPPRQPLSALPARRARSLRRTTHVDIGPPDGGHVAAPRSGREEALSDAGCGAPVIMVVSGAARELRTSVGGASTVVDATSIEAGFDGARRLARLETRPHAAWSQELLGQRSGGGFRRALNASVPQKSVGSLVWQVLDDLPAALLISGYSWMRLARLAGQDPAGLVPPEVLPRMTDLCSGWRDGGVAVESVRLGRGVPVQDCPPATDLGGSDPEAWHSMPVLRADWMRRRRCVDVSPLGNGTTEIWAMFRDTIAESDGAEVVLHEYSLSLSLVTSDDEGPLIATVEATPHVLPFPECPAAATAVAALAGHRLLALPSLVPHVLEGVGSCTHLNDLLRSVGGGAPSMVAAGTAG